MGRYISRHGSVIGDIPNLSVATIYSSPVSGDKVTCPEGWVDANDLDMGCLLMHHKELNHKVHTWPKSDEFCREFGENSRMVEVHSLEQKQFLDQLVASEGYYYHWTGAT